jgi:quercetin dioxygenase-like cupin family protein
MSDAVVHGPGEGEIHGVGPTSFTIKATAADTNGQFYFAETTVEAGFPGPPPHTHERMTDMFYVLEGTLTIHVDGEDREAGPGTFACFPPGVVHTFANRSDAPVRFLGFSTPGGFEGYMRELGKALESSEFTPDLIASLAERYDINVV